MILSVKYNRASGIVNVILAHFGRVKSVIKNCLHKPIAS